VTVISVILSALAFLCPLLGAGIGMALRQRLPEHHLSRESIDVIKLAMGLMATLVALTLGLLIQSASLYRTTVETEYRQILASIVHLDEYLHAYGPGANEIRQHIRLVAARSFQARWPNENFGPTGPMPDGARDQFTDVQRQIVELEPATAAQRWFQSQALQITNRLSDLRGLLMTQEATTAPLVPVFILIFLSSIAIFGSFCLYVRPNPTVFSVIALTALAIAGATFLIVEMNNPFHGLLYIASRGAHAVMQAIGQ
jgi:hypothetical protein